MSARIHPDPCGGIRAIENTKATLTNDPQDFTEISSLFQTFGQQDVSSGEDDDSEGMAGTHCAGYDRRGAATTPSGQDVDAYSSSTYAQRGDHVARASSSSVSRAGQGSLSSRRSRHPFNRSSHNPYVLLGSSDVNRPEQEASAMENSSRAVRRRRSSYSYSNNTSQNALMFDGTIRRHPSQQLQQQQPVDAPSTRFWRDGNRMTLSTTDVRPIPITTVGTLTCSDKEQNFNVNVKQRVRPSANSASCSLNTSSMTMPVVQSVSPAPTSASAMAHVSSIPEAALPVSLGAASNAPRFATSGGSASEDRSSCGPSSQQLDRRCADVAASTPSRADGIELTGQRRSEPEVSPFTPCHYPSKTLYYQHPQQQPYGYGVHARPYPLQQHHQQAYVYGGYPSHNYPAMPPQQGYYAQITAPPKQQQQYYAPPAPNSSLAMLGSAADGAPSRTFAEVAYASMPPPAQAPYMASAGAMMGPYSYLPMPPMAHYAGVALGSFADVQSATQRQTSGNVAAHVQHTQALAVVAADPTPAAAACALGKPTKAKSQHADPPQQHHQSAKKVAAPDSVSSLASTLTTASKAGTQSVSTVTRTSAALKPARSSSKKLPKNQDDARFHVNRDAPVRLFVVVKRKREGQRYACALTPEEVPVGSHMLVEGDRGADIGEVVRHVSMEQMARDCAIVERLRQRAVERMPGGKEGIVGNAHDDAANAGLDEADLPHLTGEAAREYVMSLKTWPWLIGPATAEDMASLGPQLEAEKQAYATAKPIVQQFIENRYLQRVARNEAALAAAAATAEGSKTADAVAAVAEQSGECSADHASTDDGDRRRNVTPLSVEELKMLELSREVTLLDCEYQFTREKITLYVSRPSRNIFVDFRSMQRKLFRTFRCRIWIAYMDEVTHDKDAPESFVFVPSPSTPFAAAAPTRGDAKDTKDVV
ncbi:PSP1 C-terminal conserved region family protein [Leishmania donovani]|uniref:PSP1 C-terminal conserved region family protein n=1 Tax=Leishmania donovani TaxID=5661 RepID=A0A504YD26_LEIDO|nr:PSP1 C-terminal conserved region family protein [Leishmania donovani]